MTSSDYWDADDAARYDQASAFMFAPDVLDPTVAVLVDLAGDGPALELAVGTGRVAIPLAERGIAVSGIELWIPGIRRFPPGQEAVPFHVGSSHVGFDTYDMTTQQGTSHHYRRETDGTVRYGASNFRYIWPAECDLMARLAGLELERRTAGWSGEVFTNDSESHVSVWRKPR